MVIMIENGLIFMKIDKLNTRKIIKIEKEMECEFIMMKMEK